jgi:hypothetical protein
MLVAGACLVVLNAVMLAKVIEKALNSSTSPHQHSFHGILPLGSMAMSVRLKSVITTDFTGFWVKVEEFKF